ncbi:hypothetical protein [Clostridium felsineum]|nr:hypothetical protein [Clostridium felsineum]URZ15837.1 hypothetical protein CLFE_018840 [Clostridium felsineum DSM 794]
MKISTKVINIKKIENFLGIATNAAKYRIILLNDDIIRIRCTFNKEFEKE